MQAKDIVDLAHALLTKGAVIEDELGLTEFLFSEEQCVLPWGEGSRRAAFNAYARHLAVAMCLQKSNAGDDQSRHVLLSRDCHPSAAIQIDTTVDDASGESRDDYKWPMTISGEFRVASEPETVFEGIELSEIVVAAVENSSNELIIAAIAEALRRRGNGYFSWFINPAFGKSVRTLVGKGKPALARSLLRACVETIIGENMAGTHALRSGPGANAERVIRVRDKAAAMRRDIDQEYHLHYWSTSNGPEFAAMVVHADMSIPH